ncbi:MAG: hypothetical protein HYV76_00460 [Candidatus Vogelbacteria bacterium]|nr:hypothetical protein [Candidatus Vogelbacteria bacterium]
MTRWQGNKRASVFTPVLVVLLVIIVIVLTKSVYGLYQKKVITTNHRQQTEQELSESEARKAALVAVVELLKTPRGEEAEIRANFPIVWPGEQVITVVEDTSASSNASTTEISLWQRLFQEMFKKKN